MSILQSCLSTLLSSRRRAVGNNKEIQPEHVSMPNLHRTESEGTQTHGPNQKPQGTKCVWFHKVVQSFDMFLYLPFNEGLSTSPSCLRKPFSPCCVCPWLLHHDLCYHICNMTSVSLDGNISYLICDVLSMWHSLYPFLLYLYPICVPGKAGILDDSNPQRKVWEVWCERKGWA